MNNNRCLYTFINVVRCFRLHLKLLPIVLLQLSIILIHNFVIVNTYYIDFFYGDGTICLGNIFIWIMV